MTQKPIRTPRKHRIPIVQELVDMTYGHKDYMLHEAMGIGDTSYLTCLRTGRVRNPRIERVILLAGVLGYDIVLKKRETKDNAAPPPPPDGLVTDAMVEKAERVFLATGGNMKDTLEAAALLRAKGAAHD